MIFFPQSESLSHAYTHGTAQTERRKLETKIKRRALLSYQYDGRIVFVFVVVGKKYFVVVLRVSRLVGANANANRKSEHRI